MTGRGVCVYCGEAAVLRLRRAHRWAVLDVLMPYPWRAACAGHAGQVIREIAGGRP